MFLFIPHILQKSCFLHKLDTVLSWVLCQDLSYYCCLELLGPEEQLLGALCTLTSKDTGEETSTFHPGTEYSLHIGSLIGHTFREIG